MLCYRFKSSKAEVAFLCDYLKLRLSQLSEDSKPKDGIVCLFPSKRILAAYFDMLSPCVPCARRTTGPSHERLWLERFLDLLVRPGQRFLERLLLDDYTEIKPRHCAMIIQRIVEKNLAPSAACSSLAAGGAFKGKALAAVQAFAAACGALATRDLPALASIAASRLHLGSAEVLAQIEALMTADSKDRGEMVEPICDLLLPATAAPVPDPRTVMFLTMHGSKGLTRRTVVIPGFEEACLPGEATGSDLDEKKRLFFVALSRATDNVLVTFPHYRGGNDSLNFDMPGRGDASPFIAAAGLAAQYHT